MQRETREGDVYAAGRSMRSGTGAEPEAQDPEDGTGAVDDGLDVPTVVRPVIVRANIRAGRNAYVALDGDMTVITSSD